MALKLIAPELAGRRALPPPLPARAKLAAALDHPNVIPIYEAGERDGQLYLAMRYVEGHDLRAEPPGPRPDRALASSPRSPARSTQPTVAASCTATSSPPTSSSTPTATPT